jgi:uncharacterized protein (TIGR03435 family)
MRTSPARRTTLLSLLLFIPAAALPAAAQQSAAPPSAPGKAFDVVSIRRNLALGSRPPHHTPSPNGVHVIHVPAVLVLMIAYPPQAGGMFLPNNIDNMPEWLLHETYDIDARIADEDRAAWTDPRNQPAMLQQMLQSMFANRFKLVVHRQMKENSVYELVIAKGGIKFAQTTPAPTTPGQTKPDPTTPAQPRPDGLSLPDGGAIGPGPNGLIHMSNLSMQMLATVLSEKSDRPIVDNTGLTGRYTFDIRQPQQDRGPSTTPDASPDPNANPAMSDVLKAIGLDLKPAKQQVEFLIIDHIERPTEN